MQLWFNGLVAFTALFGVLLGIYQIRESRLSSAENARDVARSFRLAERSADAAERAVKAVENAAATGTESLRLARENTRLEQRAWVAPTEAVQPTIKEGAYVHFSMWITNTGKTPARRCVSDIGYKTLGPGEAFDPSKHVRYKRVEDPGVIVLFPGTRFSVPVTGDVLLSEATVAALKAGGIVIHLYGRIAYDDVFGQRHTTTYCNVLETDLKNLKACATYNDAN